MDECFIFLVYKITNNKVLELHTKFTNELSEAEEHLKFLQEECSNDWELTVAMTKGWF